jgi:hypothetical protein
MAMGRNTPFANHDLTFRQDKHGLIIQESGMQDMTLRRERGNMIGQRCEFRRSRVGLIRQGRPQTLF